MSNPSQNIDITINTDFYKNDFITKLNGHYTSLKVFLTNLESEDFIEKSKLPRNKSRVSLNFIHLNVPKLHQQECNKCFRNTVQTTMDFLDTIIALINIQEGKIKINKTFSDQNEFFIFLKEELNREIQRVSRDRRLSYKDKVRKFNLDKFSIDTLDSYIDLRHCLEHHKGIPKRSIKLTFKQFVMFANDQKIKKLPFVATTGTISAKIVKGQKTYKASQEVEISEQIIENIIFTLQTFIAPRIMKFIISGKRKNIT